MLAVQCGEKLGLNDDPGFDAILRGNISTELELWKELVAAFDILLCRGSALLE